MQHLPTHHTSRGKNTLRRQARCMWAAALTAIVTQLGSAGVAQAATDPQVTLPQGQVRGLLGSGVRQFLGIRYAQAARWQAPMPAPAWTGTLNATKFGATCAQKGSLLSADSKSEDCLFLNVYVPDDIGTGPLPVMAWIHGGGFGQGAGSDYTPTVLALKARAVVVTFNYRLGAYGFFALPQLVANNPNVNFGLQDQQAALRWVRDNIAAFGGDKDRVTIFGESAGGTSICLNQVSPQSAGLFQRAISQSGPCTILTGDSIDTLRTNSVNLAVKLGCPQGTDQLACMRSKAVADINDAAALTIDFINRGVTYGPVVDGVSVPDTPARLISQGRFTKTPVIYGTNHDEARLFTALNYHLKQLSPVSAKQFAQAQAVEAGNDPAIQAQLAATYTTASYGSRDKALSAAETDRQFSCHANHDAGVFSAQVPTWSYEFNSAAPGIGLDPYMNLGAFHGLELLYLFQTKLPGPPLLGKLSTTQQALADKMVQFWGQFAATGNPNGTGAVTWPQHTTPTRAIMNLAPGTALAPITSAAFRADHRCDLWESIWAKQGILP